MFVWENRLHVQDIWHIFTAKRNSCLKKNEETPGFTDAYTPTAYQEKREKAQSPTEVHDIHTSTMMPGRAVKVTLVKMIVWSVYVSLALAWSMIDDVVLSSECARTWSPWCWTSRNPVCSSTSLHIAGTFPDDFFPVNQCTPLGKRLLWNRCVLKVTNAIIAWKWWFCFASVWQPCDCGVYHV